LRFVFEGTGLLSSPQPGEQSCYERNAPSLISALAGSGARSNAVTRTFRGAKLPRSNQKRGKQADEHDRNQRRKFEQCRSCQSGRRFSRNKNIPTLFKQTIDAWLIVRRASMLFAAV